MQTKQTLVDSYPTPSTLRSVLIYDCTILVAGDFATRFLPPPENARCTTAQPFFLKRPLERATNLNATLNER
jgi:hypothetical protein